MNLPENGAAGGSGKHSLALKNREKLTLDGILDVLSFDEGCVQLKTALGSLFVEGEGLHISKLLLDSGEVALEGKIGALYYEEGKTRARGRLFGR